MDKAEVRLRCIEAAARFPTAHQEGPAAGVLALAGQWAEWVFEEQKYGGPHEPYPANDASGRPLSAAAVMPVGQDFNTLHTTDGFGGKHTLRLPEKKK